MLSSYHFWQNIQIKAWYFGPTEDKILAFFNRLRQMFPQCRKFLIAQRTVITFCQLLIQTKRPHRQPFQESDLFSAGQHHPFHLMELPFFDRYFYLRTVPFFIVAQDFKFGRQTTVAVFQNDPFCEGLLVLFVIRPAASAK